MVAHVERRFKVEIGTRKKLKCFKYYSRDERNGASAKIAEANLRMVITTAGWGSSCSDVNDQRNIFFAEATIAHMAP